MGTDKVRRTLGTASNKIYEYAASGLPVILYDNEQFRKYLTQYPWAFFIDGSPAMFIDCIHTIINNYKELSSLSRSSFEKRAEL